jgi:hypothetical protein
MKMRSHLAIASAIALAVPATLASAASVMLDFEDVDLQGQTLISQFESLGISFSGSLFNNIDYGNYAFEQAVVRDLRGAFSDADVEAVSTGSGLTSATIGFESVAGQTLTAVDFMVARVISQDITIVAVENGTGQTFTHTFSATGPESSRVVEEFLVNLDALFGNGFTSRQWSAVAIHNHGGMFGVDNVSYETQPSIPVVPGVGALAGFVGLAGLRGRRR